jgi:hypothetical protein
MTRGCGLRETSRVDYTERRKTEREKENVLHHRPTTERREVLCEKEKLNKFLNFIKVCHNE